MSKKIEKGHAEWREQLSPETYRVTRQGATERPFTGRYHDCKEAGTYHCVCCDEALFSSEHKYDSKSGWPSYWAPFHPDAHQSPSAVTAMAMRTRIVFPSLMLIPPTLARLLFPLPIDPRCPNRHGPYRPERGGHRIRS